MKTVDTFGLLKGEASHLQDRARPSSVKPSSIKPSSNVTHDASKSINRNFEGSMTRGIQGNRTLLSGKAKFPILEAVPFFGAQGPAVGPARLNGAPAYGQRSNAGLKMGQKDPLCEQTPDGGAVCSDGTYQTPACGDPESIAKAAPAGSTEAASGSSALSSSYTLPVLVGVGVLGAMAFLLLR